MNDYYEPNLEIHEAGHVIARLLTLYNIPAQESKDFIRIEINYQEDTGRVKINPYFTDSELNYFKPEIYTVKSEIRNKLLKEASIKLAGVAAECELNFRPIPVSLSTTSMYPDIDGDLLTCGRCCTNIMRLDGVVFGTDCYHQKRDLLSNQILIDTLNLFKNDHCKRATLQLSKLLKEKNDHILEGDELINIINELMIILKPLN